MRLVGVDGCRAGWVLATSDVADVGPPLLSDPTFSIEPSFGALLDRFHGHRTLIAVDIPIGLPSGGPPDHGRRRVDGEARALLGSRRAASVFSAPCRPTLGAASYREACDLEVRARGSGKGLSQQAYNIIPKIREVDQVLTPAHQAPIDDSAQVWVREVHPEVTFARLSPGGYGLIHPKRGCRDCRKESCLDADGRVRILREYLPSFDPTVERARLLRTVRDRALSGAPRLVKGVPVGRDDVVDAAACLLTALRIVTGTSLTLPVGDPEDDTRGLRMEIVA